MLGFGHADALEIVVFGFVLVDSGIGIDQSEVVGSLLVVLEHGAGGLSDDYHNCRLNWSGGGGGVYPAVYCMACKPVRESSKCRRGIRPWLREAAVAR